MNRLRPPKDCKDLAVWLSGVVWDAVKDAKDAGMPAWDVKTLMAIIARDCVSDWEL